MAQHNLAYHGGDMEGNSVRRLMEQGTEIFQEVATFVKGWLIMTTVDEGIEEDNILDEEIDSVCVAFGRILVLLDEIFSILMTPRGQVTAEVVAKLKSQLELARIKWNELNFSSTPKFHVLLNHAADQLEQMNGFADMGEDSIERNHQTREKDRHRHSRLRDKQQAKDSQARFQNIRTLDEIKKVQSQVQDHSRRNLKRAVPLRVERELVRSAKRIATRDGNSDLIQNETRAIMPTPRNRLKREYQMELEEQEED
jgi:hypothetical protein